ncbi:MAG: hypothetical protein ACYDDZ_14280 [Acidimicrobiales bacterium]
MSSREDRQLDEQDDDPHPLIDTSGSFTGPPVMWPAASSEFAADPYSPAGTVQNVSVFSRGIARFRHGKLVVWLLLSMFLLAPIIMVIALLIRSR